MSLFKRATKANARLRMAIIGGSGFGKTYSALSIAPGLGSRTVVLDTEHGSASKYADKFDFDTLVMERHHPQEYIDAIRAAEQEGYDVIIIDSLSHAWIGRDGALELVDKKAKSGGGNSFGAWRDVTPLHMALIDAIVGSRCHVIATMRSKMDYVIEDGDRGKKSVRKIGMAAVQRDGLEYEFDIVGEMNADNEMRITKTRCSALRDATIVQPGADLAATLKAWLTGEPLPEIALIDAIGDELYPADWLASKRAELAQWATAGASSDLSALTPKEAATVLAKMRAKRDEAKTKAFTDEMEAADAA